TGADLHRLLVDRRIKDLGEEHGLAGPRALDQLQRVLHRQQHRRDVGLALRGQLGGEPAFGAGLRIDQLAAALVAGVAVLAVLDEVAVARAVLGLPGRLAPLEAVALAGPPRRLHA